MRLIDEFAMAVGHFVMAVGGIMLGALFCIGVSMLVNRATWKIVECYGGMKTLREFGRWYRDNKGEKSETT